ncbi:DivIVA domain-containing protein [Micromonospora sp. NPDC000089]|uniref:DivIVA domain-containing protein n=1 Tax=unclassified Micromonospora TaxID=2617518 RepID=UPI0036A0B5E0
MSDVYRGGRLYGVGGAARLTPHEVRNRAFDIRRRGADPDQVRGFQAQVADELNDLHQRVRLLGQENDRIKRALRDWQSRHARECPRPNAGPR